MVSQINGQFSRQFPVPYDESQAVQCPVGDFKVFPAHVSIDREAVRALGPSRWLYPSPHRVQDLVQLCVEGVCVRSLVAAFLKSRIQGQ